MWKNFNIIYSEEVIVSYKKVIKDTRILYIVFA